jgi:uroporphyrinogen-III synthase
MGFEALRVIALESRRSAEMETLIRKNGGEPFVAPSMRETPLEDNTEAWAFAERLFAGEFDMAIFLTGVGTRALAKVLATRYPAEAFPAALRKITVVARGPKPLAALTEINVPVTVKVPEPNTWRELLAATEGRTEKKIAVQEYGKSNPELLDALRARGADVTAVRVYSWALPHETAPLAEAARRIAHGEADVVMFTTSIQIPHLFQMAEQQGLDLMPGFARAVIGSIGPTTSEMLAEYGLSADLEPSHPKMGILVAETATNAVDILRRKR